MSKPNKLSHIVYQTRRFDAMIAWYQTVFGARVVHRNPALAFLTFDDEHHRFAFANLDALGTPGGDPGATGSVGVNHVGYTFESVAALLDAYVRLSDIGIEPYWSIHHGSTLSNYYRDPDGNRMEFQVDADTGYLDSPAFAQNPIGVQVDMAALLARHRAGAPASELLAMPAGEMSAIPPEHGFV